jgi:hypothetical protein
MADESELDRLDPEPVTIELVSGFPVDVVRMKTRQLFRFMRILVKGGANIPQLDLSNGAENLGAQLMGILIMAIPEAESETISFLQSMSEPHGVIKKPVAQLSKAENEHNKALFDRYGDEMFNPELDDTLALLEAIVAREAPELLALGKKIQKLATVARKAVGAAEPKPPQTEELALQGATPGSSTSSPTSTAGPTSTSSTSPYAGSARPRKPRAAAGA